MWGEKLIDRRAHRLVRLAGAHCKLAIRPHTRRCEGLAGSLIKHCLPGGGGVRRRGLLSAHAKQLAERQYRCWGRQQRSVTSRQQRFRTSRSLPLSGWGSPAAPACRSQRVGSGAGPCTIAYKAAQRPSQARATQLTTWRQGLRWKGASHECSRGRHRTRLSLLPQPGMSNWHPLPICGSHLARLR